MDLDNGGDIDVEEFTEFLNADIGENEDSSQSSDDSEDEDLKTAKLPDVTITNSTSDIEKARVIKSST